MAAILTVDALKRQDRVAGSPDDLVDTATDQGRPHSRRGAIVPLEAGEWTELDCHKRGEYFLIIHPSRRQVSCRTRDWVEAKDFKDRFDKGLPPLKPADLSIGPILEAAMATAGRSEQSVLRKLLKYWGKKKVGDLDKQSTQVFYEHNKTRHQYKPSYMRRLNARLGAFIRKEVRKSDPNYTIEVFLPKKGEARLR